MRQLAALGVQGLTLIEGEAYLHAAWLDVVAEVPSEAWIGGNVRDASLEEIWRRAPALAWGRSRGVGSLSGFCRSCYYAEECLGGCTFTAFSLSSQAGNNPYCHHRALSLAEAGLRERLVRVEAAPGRPFDHARFELILETRVERHPRLARLTEIATDAERTRGRKGR